MIDNKSSVYDKLFVVSHSDLSLSVQAVQGMHALVAYCLHNPENAWKWHLSGNTIVFLSAKNEQEFKELVEQIEWECGDKACIKFMEPDMNDAFTAFCARGDAERFLKKLPLVGV